MSSLKPSKKQAAVMRLKNVKEHLIALTGSIRSGKTLFGAFGFAILMEYQQTKNPLLEGNRYAIVAQANVNSTYKNIGRRVITLLKFRGWKVKKQGNIHDYQLTKGNTTFFIDHFSVNNKRSYEKLIGGTYRGMFIDEAPLMSGESLDKMVGRCSSFDDHKIVLTGNPQGSVAHWFYKKYLSGIVGVLDVRFNMLDNPTMTQENIDSWKSIMSKATFQQYVLGLWVIAEGQCYDELPPIVDVSRETVEYILFGIDYGEATDETTLLTTLKLKDGPYVIVGNYAHTNVGETKRKNVNDYHREIREEINKMMIKYQPEKGAMCSVEYSPPSLYYLMSDDLKIDKRVDIVKANKTSILKQNKKENGVVNERTDIVNTMILTGMLKTTSHKFPIIEEMQEARYEDGKRVGKDHSLDGLEYGLRPDFRYIIEDIGLYELENEEEQE